MGDPGSHEPNQTCQHGTGCPHGHLAGSGEGTTPTQGEGGYGDEPTGGSVWGVYLPSSKMAAPVGAVPAPPRAAAPPPLRPLAESGRG